MNKIKKAISGAAAGALLALAVGAGAIATAAPAQAATTNCRFVDAGYGRIILGSDWPGYRYGALCYTNYNWWEENFWPWPRDHSWWGAFNSRPCEPNITYYVRAAYC